MLLDWALLSTVHRRHPKPPRIPQEAQEKVIDSSSRPVQSKQQNLREMHVPPGRMTPGCRTVQMVPLGASQSGSSCALGEESKQSTGTPRLSQEFCSYRLCDDDGDDFWTVPSQSSQVIDIAGVSPCAASNCFALDGGDSDNEDSSSSRRGLQESTLENMFSFNLEQSEDLDRLELEDVFSFDLDKVAEALRWGAGVEQLQEIIEQSMAANFASPASPSETPGIFEPSPLMAGDLSGRMTPGRETPEINDTEELAASSDCLNKCLAQLPTPMKTTRHRRASVLHNPLSAAVDEACARSRRSVALVAAQEYRTQIQTQADNDSVDSMAGAIQENAKKSHKRRRQSILQAAEVIELASVCEERGFCEDWGAEHLTAAQLTMQLQMVQQAIEGARQRHCEHSAAYHEHC